MLITLLHSVFPSWIIHLFINRYNTIKNVPKILILWKMARIQRRKKALEQEDSVIFENQITPLDAKPVGR